MSERKQRGRIEPAKYDGPGPRGREPVKPVETDKYDAMALGKTPERYMVRVKKVVFEGFITLTEDAAHKLQDELWTSKAEDEETIVFLRRGTPPAGSDFKTVDDLRAAIKKT